MPAADRILAEARRFLGVPFRHQGRSVRGLDCAGLVLAVRAALGLPAYDVTGYPRTAAGMAFLTHCRLLGDPVPLAGAQPGDVLLFTETVYPCHVAFLSETRGAPHLIHAHAPRRVVMEEPFDADWRAKVRMAFRLHDREPV